MTHTLSPIIARLRDAQVGWTGDAACVDAETAACGADVIELLVGRLDAMVKALEETSTSLGNMLDLCAPARVPDGGLFERARAARDNARAALSAASNSQEGE